MMNKKIKRAMCGLAASLCLVGSTVPVFAETVDFNVTVPGDILSKRAEKADSDRHVRCVRRSAEELPEYGGNCVVCGKSHWRDGSGAV